MGSPIAANLVKAGFPVVGYDVVAEKRRELQKAGGSVARSVGEVRERSDVVICSLPSAKALADVTEELATARGGAAVVVETSTMPIADKERARQRLASVGVTLLDCPLSGTGAQAKTGDLVVFGSGILSKYRKTVPVLKGFSRSQHYLGRFGNGSKMKFAANLLVAIHNVSSAEAVILARRSGLDPALAVKVLGDGAGASRMLQVRGPLMVRRAYRPATVTNETWRKDMKIIGAFVRGLRSPAPLFNRTRAIYREALRRGFAQADTAAVAAVLERKKASKA